MGKHDKKICCICGKPYRGYGNNPEPVKSEGRCCDECNKTIVLRAKVRELKRVRDANR